jgi:hypothetical protein
MVDLKVALMAALKDPLLVVLTVDLKVAWWDVRKAA